MHCYEKNNNNKKGREKDLSSNSQQKHVSLLQCKETLKRDQSDDIS